MVDSDVCFRCGYPIRPGSPYVVASGGRCAHLGCTAGALSGAMERTNLEIGAEPPESFEEMRGVRSEESTRRHERALKIAATMAAATVGTSVWLTRGVLRDTIRRVGELIRFRH
jgi:hypothetical protein